PPSLQTGHFEFTIKYTSTRQSAYSCAPPLRAPFRMGMQAPILQPRLELAGDLCMPRDSRVLVAEERSVQ
ncbi:unnamed protein product, partial [Mycena citricolor]